MAEVIIENMGLSIPTFGLGGKSLRASIASSVNLVKKLDQDCVTVLQDVNLSIRDGERVGLVGPNGAGKTSFLRLLANIYHPTTGYIKTSGTIKTLISLGSGLDPNLSGIENIKRICLLQSERIRDIDKIAKDVAEFSELGDFLHMPVRTYSSGMTLRLISGTVFTESSDIFLVDEFFATGDENFTEKVRQKMESQVNQSKIFVFATHNPALIRQYCNRVLIFRDGNIVEGDIDKL